MRILVMGAGAVGGYFGAKLAAAGENVLLVARGDHLAAVQRDGLRIDEPDGRTWTAAVSAVSEPRADEPPDLVLIATKGGQLEQAAEIVAPVLGAHSVVLPLLNGLTVTDRLAKRVPAEMLLAGSCRIMASRVEPGVVRRFGNDATIVMGERERPPTDRVRRIRDVFVRAGIGVETPDDMRRALWEKFLFIEPLGAVGALVRVPIGSFRHIPETRVLLEAALREVIATANACEVALDPDALQHTLSRIDALPASGTSSLQRDIVAGRPSELDDWTGELVRLARSRSVAIPVHETLFAALRPQELLARGLTPSA